MIDQIIEKGIVPDFFIRRGIRHLLAKRLKDEYKNFNQISALIDEFKNSPMAIETDKANDQHYMVPTEFYHYCLGANLKYSSAYWDKAQNLDQAELEMLELTVKRAGIKDGDHILELGHGWGALTLFMGAKFPNSQITAISNSRTQGEYIKKTCSERNINNINIITGDVSKVEVNQVFDRVISIEMFEHFRNFEKLLEKVDAWLKPDGKLFVHMFVHKEIPYKFDVIDDSDWMSKYFFSGGIMPNDHFFNYFQKHLVVEKQWKVSGEHYAKTARAWLDNMDQNKSKILAIFKNHYPQGEALKWFNYWRVFFMSCEELWGFRNGDEWFVGHYLLEKGNK
jgi:cyclopropane-fatty-acyl-phospholipid synthase